MESTAHRAIAIVGVGAVLPDAPNVAAFWKNIKEGRYSIKEVSPDRWDPALYYDPDHNAPDKTYSKIGGWVREHTWDPIAWRLPIPPRVAQAMDGSQKWGIACTREALEDYGYPKRSLDLDREQVRSPAIRRRVPGRAVSPGPDPLSPRRGNALGVQ